MIQPDSPDTQRSLALEHLYGLVICSNSASQLWPLSREHAPLELQPDAQSGLSPLAKVIRAVAPYCAAPLLIAAPHDMAALVEQHIAEHSLLALGEYKLLDEPYPRGTALTTAFAATLLKRVDSHALLVCLPASNSFDADDRWVQTLARAVKAAECNRIAIVGSSTAPLSRPLGGGVPAGAVGVWGLGSLPEAGSIGARGGYPTGNGREGYHDGYRDANRDGGRDTGYDSERQTRRTTGRDAGSPPALLGTIRMGPELKECEGAYHVRSFVSRPGPAVAWRAQQNKSLWSTHIFVCKADIALGELYAASHDDNDPSRQALARIAETARFFLELEREHWDSKAARELFETLPILSFEEAIFETTRLLAAIPTSIGFFDLTTLAGYERTLDADASGNRLRGKTLAVQTWNSTVLADAGKLVVTLGLEDALVIDTPDATLVTTHKALDSVPAMMAALRATNASEL